MPQIKFIFSMVGILDLQYTLRAVHQEDVIETLLQGKSLERKVIDTFGFEVKTEFLIDAIRGNYHDLATVKEDLEKINIPMVFLVSEKDQWVNVESVRSLFKTKKDTRELFILPNTMHQIYENPVAARRAIKLCVVFCTKYLYGKKVTSEEVLDPSIHEIAFQDRFEKRKLRNILSVTKEEEKDFWANYLSNYRVIEKSEEFRDLLATIYFLLGGLKNKERILDLGCGNGHFGAWCLGELMKELIFSESQVKAGNLIHYVGLDFERNALEDARKKHQEIQEKFFVNAEKKQLKGKLWCSDYICADIDEGLPFSDGYFDKVCCNLVLSYLKRSDVTVTIREILRVLKRGGKVVLTSLKPFHDLSSIYCNFMKQTESVEDIVEGKKLFSAAGKIKFKGDVGYYSFYSLQEMENLLIYSGVKKVKGCKSFGNQVNVTFAEKF